MAKNLFETLNKQMQAPDQQIGMTDQTAQTQSLLRTKLGKANSGSSAVPGISNIQEQQAVQGAQNQQTQQAQSGVVQAQQETQQDLGQQAQTSQQFQALDDRQKELVNNFQVQTSDLLQDFQRGNLKLDDAKDAAKTEQLGFQLRLQDQSYLDKLKSDGDLDRFNNAQDFKVAAAEQEVSDNTALLSMGLDAQAFANMNDADFTKALGTMDVNSAIQLFQQQQEQQQKMAKYKMLGSIVSTGTSYAANSSTSKGDVGT